MTETTQNTQYKFDAQFVYKEWLHICSPVLSLELAHTTNYAIGSMNPTTSLVNRKAAVQSPDLITYIKIPQLASPH